ncbi:MAG TPA: hypothetical protein VNZ26_11835 [Vicinamibacterales bacterium]|jgi:hypothetical protein|nr:hypothetical protein [Vicinamibacterales bacterium]
MMRTYLSALILAATLGVPAVPAVAHASTRVGVEFRVYDRRHHDYHRWNNTEQRAYRQYLSERRYQYHAYSRLRRERQDDYWRWRHRELEHERHERR